ncbi:MbtH family protein [Streptomyces sp. NPDC003401]
MSDTAADKTYRVVVNHEEQYSIWDAHRRTPAGWRSSGFTGDRQQCLDHIAEIWTDMRPLSIRGEQPPAPTGTR